MAVQERWCMIDEWHYNAEIGFAGENVRHSHRGRIHLQPLGGRKRTRLYYACGAAIVAVF